MPGGFFLFFAEVGECVSQFVTCMRGDKRTSPTSLDPAERDSANAGMGKD